MTTKPPEPWTRQPKETNPSWEAFVAYRDLGPKRSLREAASIVGKSLTLLENWSARHEWVRRAGLWDAEEDRAKQEGKLEAIQDMERRHGQMARLFQQKVLDRLRTIDVEDLTPAQLIQWFEVAVRVERQAAGKPTEIFGEVAVSQGEIPPPLSAEDRENVIEMAHVFRRAREQAAAAGE